MRFRTRRVTLIRSRRLSALLRLEILFAVVVAAQLHAQTSGVRGSSDTTVAHVILAVEDSINAAWLRRDTLALRRFIAADFSGITSAGTTIDRSVMLRQAATTTETNTEVADRAVRHRGSRRSLAISSHDASHRRLRPPAQPVATRRDSGDAGSCTAAVNGWHRRRLPE